MTTISAVQLPIDWTAFGWSEEPSLGGVTLSTGDPAWAWDPAAPAFAVRTTEAADGAPVDGFSVDHVVLLVPDLDAAISTMDRIGVHPRLRMKIGGNRPAAFFRVGTVLEVIESPVRNAALYGLALTAEGSLESIALEWRARGLDVGTIKPAVQPGRRIMTVHALDAGLAVMSQDGATAVAP